jgi:hypothetical protein
VTSIVLSPATPRETILVASLDSKVRLMDRSNGQVSHVISESFFPIISYVPYTTNADLTPYPNLKIQMLNTFGGPANLTPSGTTFENTSYRSKVAFGYGERSVLAGDEKGGLWVWDIVSVSSRGLFSSSFSLGSLRLNVPRRYELIGKNGNTGSGAEKGS